MPKQTSQLIISAKKSTAGRASQYSAGATSSVGTISDHLHDGTVNSGGNLAVYLRADGTITGATGQAQTFTNGIVGPSWKPAADSTTALQLQNAAGTSILDIDTTNSYVGIGTVAPDLPFHVVQSTTSGANVAHFETFSASTNSAGGVNRFHRRCTGDMTDGFGTLVNFNIEDTGIASTPIGALGYSRYGADNSGRLDLYTYNAGILSVPKMVVLPNGNVGIGTVAPETKLELSGAKNNSILRLSSTTNDSSWANTDYFGSIEYYSGDISDSGPKIMAKILAINEGGAYAGKGGLAFYTADTSILSEKIRIDRSGNIGIGTTAPATLIHGISTTATTNARRDLLTLGANVTSAGGGAAGLGVGILLKAESSTTDDTLQAMIASEWLVATHALRTARLAFSAYDTAAREGLRIDADGAAARLGLYGVAAIARPTTAIAAAAFVANTSGIVDDTATWGGYTMGQVVQALQNLGVLT